MSKWWDIGVPTGAALLGAIIGSVSTYVFERKLRKQEKRDAAYVSAALIRQWLIEKLGDVVALRERLSNQLKLLTNKSLEIITEEHAQGDFSNFGLLVNPFLEKEVLLDLDIELLKNLSTMRKLFKRFESVLQSLSFVKSQYTQVIEIKKRLNALRGTIFSKENSSVDDIELLKTYCKFLERYLPGHLTVCDHVEKNVKNVFKLFELLVCRVLKLDVVDFSKDVQTEEALIEELLQFANKHEHLNFLVKYWRKGKSFFQG